MAPQFKLFPQQIKLRVAIRYRAGRPGAELQRPHLARPRQNADRRPDGQFVTWHGGDGGSQDGIAHDPELSLIAAAALPAGDFTRAVKRLAAHAPRGPLHVRLHRRRCTARECQRQVSGVIRASTGFMLRYCFACGVARYGDSFGTSVWGLRPVGGAWFFVRKAMR